MYTIQLLESPIPPTPTTTLLLRHKKRKVLISPEPSVEAGVKTIEKNSEIEIFNNKKNGQKWSKKVKNSQNGQTGPKWPKMVPNGSKWSKMVYKGSHHVRKTVKKVDNVRFGRPPPLNG